MPALTAGAYLLSDAILSSLGRYEIVDWNFPDGKFSPWYRWIPWGGYHTQRKPFDERFNKPVLAFDSPLIWLDNQYWHGEADFARDPPTGEWKNRADVDKSNVEFIRDPRTGKLLAQ